MWPSIFEFHWDAGHMIFLGVFYAVITTMTTALVYVIVKSVIESFKDDGSDGDQHDASTASADTHLSTRAGAASTKN